MPLYINSISGPYPDGLPVGEVEEPRVVLVRPQRGEPHLPVEARLVRQAEGRGGGQVARLVREVVLPPRAGLSQRALHDDLGAPADAGHGAKQAVGVGDL